MNNIPELQGSRKTTQYVLVGILILLGIVSFGLGRLSATVNTRPAIQICSEELFTEVTPSQTATVINAPAQQTDKYVASKNGTVYHLPWCSGAQRILEENKVWFASKEDAEKAGYRPATNCKGI